MVNFGADGGELKTTVGRGEIALDGKERKRLFNRSGNFRSVVASPGKPLGRLLLDHNSKSSQTSG